MFDYLSRHPDQGLVFARGMAGAAQLFGGLADSYGWPAAGTVVVFDRRT
jgi:hypothetical protein